MPAENKITLDVAAHCAEEIRLLELLGEAQKILSDALNSLGGNKVPAPHLYYVVQLCRPINQSAEGYLLLRRIGLIDASRLLIRPMLESIFSASATVVEQSFFVRKAYSEWKDEEKFFCKDQDSRKKSTEQWDGFIAQLQSNHPEYPIDLRSLNIYEVAQIAGMTDVYNAHYRLYCKFTHVAFGAIAGPLKQIAEPFDTRTAIICVLKASELLRGLTDATVPDLSPYLDRLKQ